MLVNKKNHSFWLGNKQEHVKINMANLTNIFINICSFYTEILDLVNEMDLYFYLEKRIGTQWNFIKIATKEELAENIDEHYRSFFISSETFDPGKFDSFYDDEFCVHAIEGLGGRHTKDELEMLSLRIISKTPDKKVKSFIDKFVKMLKRNSRYGQGVGPGASSLYKKTFYNRLDVQGRTLWFDFERKISQANIGGD
ncbi:hypothetical protein [Chitinophaga pinensis]|uniref:Uncharacterized protein n=1 Tax=Chitinophaga pinensis (strain ATCC 43595 / DSM 2588 / LMG 13176 / NBRC 15968 / NCIMB 11800 / UQM 2034) TaxID=485918 RepID=A0A979G4A7_CHIPD|nr:hypothetical protein [Chitinophaga pinensis]ACU60416.1 hypothetical protein Cpin_2937 [Chitinophaga pinensis DSM 2588]